MNADTGLEPCRALEAQRQQLLLRAVWRQAPAETLRGWLRDAPPRQQRGLAAYRANGQALAARALAAAFPTVQQLVGDDSFRALAHAFWLRVPPRDGDIATYGADLPDFIAADAQLADVPWLADCARLDWAVHRAEAAADAVGAPTGLERLGSDDPAALALVLQPGTALVASPWPVVLIHQAHHGQPGDAADRFAPVRAALAAGRGEQALVWRAGWRARVTALAEADATFTAALLQCRPLAAALDAAGPGFEFEPWLIDSLQCGRIAAVQALAGRDPGDRR